MPSPCRLVSTISVSAPAFLNQVQCRMIVTARSQTGIRIMENEKSAPHRRAGRELSRFTYRHSKQFSEPGVSACDCSGNWRQLLSRYLELDVLATIFVFAAASFIFLKLVSEMREGDTSRAAQAILLALRDPNDLSNPIGPEWVETMCQDLTSLGSPTVLTLITIAAVGCLSIDGKRPSCPVRRSLDYRRSGFGEPAEIRFRTAAPRAHFHTW